MMKRHVRYSWMAFFALMAGTLAQSATHSNIFDIRTFGASGKKADNATLAIRKAVEACYRAGGGVVYLPPGAYTSGVIELKQNVTLYIEAGATLFLSHDPADFAGGPRALLYLNGAKNISVAGMGTLDGEAQYEWSMPKDEDVEIIEETRIARQAGLDMRRSNRVGLQANMLLFINSTNVHIEDVSVINSPEWTMRVESCERVFIRGVYVYSDLEKGVNADGIDLVSSRDVTISDSLITTGDDAIVLKTIPSKVLGGGAAKPVENVTVTNCVLTSSSTALMIGTETYADIRHVVFSNSVIRDSNKGFGINVQDGATVSDIVFTNLTIELNRRHWNWWGSAETFKFVLKKRTPSSKLGVIRDIVIDNVISHARGTSSIQGDVDRPLENIRISRLQTFMLPENVIDKRATDALRIERVNGCYMRDVWIAWSADQVEEKWQSGLSLKDVTDFELEGFRGRQGTNSDAAAITADNVRDGVIRNSHATQGCGTFLHVRGEGTGNIRLINNDLAYARRQVKATGGAKVGSVQIAEGRTGQ